MFPIASATNMGFIEVGSVLAEQYECFLDADMVPDFPLYFEGTTKFHNLVCCLDCKYLPLWA